MKSTFTLFTLFAVSALSAQFNAPESVEYDVLHNRWIVGNNGNGTLAAFNPPTVTAFSVGTPMPSGPHGIEILGNVAYACDGGYMRGYDLTTGVQTFSLNLGASFLNGLTTDGVTYLFATDFSAKKIYRINPALNTFNLMATTIKTPNGIYYDGANNRCVFVTWGSNAPIQAMSLIDSTISTLTTSTYSNMDGVTRDNAGYWYATAWGNNSLIRWTPSFTSPTVVMSGLSSPADIDINTAGDSIAIPNSGSTTVVFYTNITTGVSLLTATQFSLFPNPSSSDCTITFDAPQFNSEAILTDVRGRIVRNIRFSGNTLLLERGDLEAGIYLLHIVNGEGVVAGSGKIIFE
ncbi:hypothetical protein BH11BAC7_BH11BAC7_21110 [soil metagenome]